MKDYGGLLIKENETNKCISNTEATEINHKRTMIDRYSLDEGGGSQKRNDERARREDVDIKRR